MEWEWLLFCLGGAAVVLGCLLPNRWLPSGLPNDKLLHFACFAVLSALALRLAHGRLESLLWLAALMAAGLALECMQALVPERRFCWRDVAANGAGIAFTAACVGVIALF